MSAPPPALRLVPRDDALDVLLGRALDAALGGWRREESQESFEAGEEAAFDAAEAVLRHAIRDGDVLGAVIRGLVGLAHRRVRNEVAGGW